MDALEHGLGGKRTLAQCHGRLPWPERGVYFFFEAGEERATSGPRVVRVGTHALKTGSKTKLWNRLSQHRGSARSGGGNHRGSIFRLIVGTALMERDGHASASWDDRQSTAPREVRAAEHPFEQTVSTTIGSMQFLWLPVNDEAGPKSARGIIERGSIALLSNWEKAAIDPPSKNWLGHHCNRDRVRTSGLWNQNHVNEEYDHWFLSDLEQFVKQAGANT
ncbi:hypothetical protein RC74_01935 [Falsihalocynthiibacter arcticus]|uniref:GIY-YIG domain-containing protein n=1 Tax=Falsihalocynthiibacter arcticus TaxID=1579316 RepID=A0A126V695_9RHOB|nr:hypothetical protein RC74_01935 [Falsihalocynthiibacter arcticus]